MDLGVGQGPDYGPLGGLRQGALELGAVPGVAIIIVAALGLIPVPRNVGVMLFLAAVEIVLSTASDDEANLVS